MFYVLFAIAVATAVAAEVYDVVMTEKGLKAGVAVEGNDWLVGDKPKALALYLRDFAVMALFIALPPIAHTLGNTPLAYGTLVGPVAAAIKHVLGGRAWAKLLKK